MLKENKALASMRDGDKLYVLCDYDGVILWPTVQAAIRDIKRFYTAGRRASVEMAKAHYSHFDIRVHVVPREVLENGVFETRIVGCDPKKAEDHQPQEVENAVYLGLLCVGGGADKWHLSGKKPAFSTK